MKALLVHSRPYARLTKRRLVSKSRDLRLNPPVDAPNWKKMMFEHALKGFPGVMYGYVNSEEGQEIKLAQANSMIMYLKNNYHVVMHLGKGTVAIQYDDRKPYGILINMDPESKKAKVWFSEDLSPYLFKSH